MAAFQSVLRSEPRTVQGPPGARPRRPRPKCAARSSIRSGCSNGTLLIWTRASLARSGILCRWWPYSPCRVCGWCA